MKTAIFSKDEVIRRLCALSTEVMEKQFDYQQAADCFCSDGPIPDEHFIFSHAVLEFIENSVRSAMSSPDNSDDDNERFAYLTE